MLFPYYEKALYKNSISIKQWAEEDRPREKLQLKGRSSLSNAELLAIILGSGYRNVTAVELARRLLSAHENSLRSLAVQSLQGLTKTKGIGHAKALTIIAAMELGRRRELTELSTRPKISSSEEAYDCVHSLMSDLPHEEFKILLLNRGNRLIKLITVSVGGVSGTVVDPKVVFKKAIELQASSIILVHNHPSGNTRPSESDIKITKKMVKAGENLDINILDHLIIGANSYYSFADEGQI
jgi:DNA repair protein RadC